MAHGYALTITVGRHFHLGKGRAPPLRGGMRVPCVVWAPGRIKAGSDSDEMMSTIDPLPTFSSLAGVKLKTKGPIDGLDQSALLLGKGSSARKEFLYYTREVQAIRQGNYKLRKTGKSVLLYDLSKDIGEKQNLVSQKPELTQKLLTRMNQLDHEVTKGMRPIGTLD